MKINVPSLPLAANVCDQLLREVYRNDSWSMAHVVMNPGAYSLLHEHRVMDEVYAITRGSGELIVGSLSYEVRAGSVVHIPANIPHQFYNTGLTSLEHLVLAAPAFDPADVIVAEKQDTPHTTNVPVTFPQVVECFDGAKIIPYELPGIDLSFAFGWVINDPARHKAPHYHKRTSEFIFVVEGKGTVEIGDRSVPVEAGDWLEVPVGADHAIRNKEDQYMIALCICSPRFDMADVHY